MKNSLTHIFLVFSFMFLACNGQKQKEFKPEVNTSPNQNPMAEKFDYESYKNKTLIGSILPNGNKVTFAYCNEDNNDFRCDQIEVAPLPNYCQHIYKTYYPNLNLESKVTSLGGTVKVGVSEYYDENGYLINSIDENKKFENVKITPEKFIELLIEYKLLDKNIINTIPANYHSYSFRFDIFYSTAEESIVGKPCWCLMFAGVVLPKIPKRNMTGIIFDAQDGLILNWNPDEIPDDLHYLGKYAKK